MNTDTRHDAINRSRGFGRDGWASFAPLVLILLCVELIGSSPGQGTKQMWSVCLKDTIRTDTVCAPVSFAGTYSSYGGIVHNSPFTTWTIPKGGAGDYNISIRLPVTQTNGLAGMRVIVNSETVPGSQQVTDSVGYYITRLRALIVPNETLHGKSLSISRPAETAFVSKSFTIPQCTIAATSGVPSIRHGSLNESLFIQSYHFTTVDTIVNQAWSQLWRDTVIWNGISSGGFGPRDTIPVHVPVGASFGISNVRFLPVGATIQVQAYAAGGTGIIPTGTAISNRNTSYVKLDRIRVRSGP